MADKKIKLYLRKGSRVLELEHAVKMFEKLKGRKATAEEIATMRKHLAAP